MFAFRSRSLEPLLLTGESSAFLPLSYRAHLPHCVAGTAVRPIGGWQAAAKRSTDIILALLFLALFGPMMLVVAVLIPLNSAGPALFRQRRIGRDGRDFEMLKFRTMYHGRNTPAALQQATRDDPRVTRIGALLRRLSFDEVPQFLNVLRGEMSIVGPRPHAPGTCAGGRLFEEVAHRYDARHRVKPGVTGLAQVRGWRGETDTEEKLLNRVASDLEYIANWSLWLDLAIIWRTLFAVLRMRNAY